MVCVEEVSDDGPDDEEEECDEPYILVSEEYGVVI